MLGSGLQAPNLLQAGGLTRNAGLRQVCQACVRLFQRRSSVPLEVAEVHRMMVEVDSWGHLFVNNYVIVRKLGQGRFGSIMLCLDTFSNNLRAMKMVQRSTLQLMRQRQDRAQAAPEAQPRGPAGPEGDGAEGGEGAEGGGGGRARPGEAAERSPGRAPPPSQRREEIQEVSVLKKLSHPNVLRMVEVIDDPVEDDLFFIMEYVDGGSIVELEPDGTCQATGEARTHDLLCQTLRGLEYLHANMVVHRDLKPDNILLDRLGVVKIVDFGVASTFSGDDDTLSDAAGTPAFMSPEESSAGAFRGKAADVWALGVTLYCLAVGRLPFLGRSRWETTNLILRKEVEFADVDVSDGLRDLLRGMPRKDPAERLTLTDVARHRWVRQGCPETHLEMSKHVPSALKATAQRAGFQNAFVSEVLQGRVPARHLAFRDGATVLSEGGMFRSGHSYVITSGECCILMQRSKFRRGGDDTLYLQNRGGEERAGGMGTATSWLSTGSSVGSLGDVTTLYSLYLRGVANAKSADPEAQMFHGRVQRSAQETLRALAAGRGETVVAVRSAGELVGEMALLQEEQKLRWMGAHRVVALGPVQALRVARGDFRQALEKNPRLRADMLRTIAVRKKERLRVHTLRRVVQAEREGAAGGGGAAGDAAAPR